MKYLQYSTIIWKSEQKDVYKKYTENEIRTKRTIISEKFAF